MSRESGYGEDSFIIDVDIRSLEEHDPGELVEFVSSVCRSALLAEGISRGEVSIVLTDDSEIRELNRSYRGIDEATDVLSFPMDDDFGVDDMGLDDSGFDDVAVDQPMPLGDIVISVERARAQALEYDHSFQRELGFLLVHGLLHLLGYDHDSAPSQDEMRDREEAILNDLGLAR